MQFSGMQYMLQLQCDITLVHLQHGMSEVVRCSINDCMVTVMWLQAALGVQQYIAGARSTGVLGTVVKQCNSRMN